MAYDDSNLDDPYYNSPTFWNPAPGSQPSIVPNTAPTINFQGTTETAVPGQPGVYVPPGMSGYAGPKDLASLVRYWKQSHPASAPDQDGLTKFLNDNGIAASRAHHGVNNSELSDDKWIINGQTYDFGTSLGSPAGAWFDTFQPIGAGGGGSVDTSGLANSSVLAPFIERGPDIKPPAPFEFKGGLPKPFHYDAFKPTTAADIFADPSYDFRFGQGNRSVMQQRIAQGLAKTGGTLKALDRYGQDFASQEFGNVDSRRYRDYSTGYGNAITEYGLNEVNPNTTDYNRQREAYDLNVVNPNQTEYGRGLTDFLNRRDTFYKNQANAFDRPMAVARLGYDAHA